MNQFKLTTKRPKGFHIYLDGHSYLGPSANVLVGIPKSRVDMYVQELEQRYMSVDKDFVEWLLFLHTKFQENQGVVLVWVKSNRDQWMIDALNIFYSRIEEVMEMLVKKPPQGETT